MLGQSIGIEDVISPIKKMAVERGLNEGDLDRLLKKYAFQFGCNVGMLETNLTRKTNNPPMLLVCNTLLAQDLSHSNKIMVKEEGNVDRGVSSRGQSFAKPISLVLAMTMMIGGTITLWPFEGTIIEAPPLAAGTLSVTWESLAPWTNTFQGDVNLTVLWLALKAEGANIVLNSIRVDVYGFPTDGINRTFLWDDYDGDKFMAFFECIIGEDATPPYVLPPNNDMRECTGPDEGMPVVIDQDETRYFTVYMDLGFDPDQSLIGNDLKACVENINSSADTVVGLPACSRTIEVNKRFFYDGMEQGQGDWTFTGGDDGGVHPDGLWHMSQGEEYCANEDEDVPFYHSDNTSWWYGYNHYLFGDWWCDYYTHQSGAPLLPTRNWGELRTPWIDARKGSSLALTIWHLLSKEPFMAVDVASVYLDDGDGWHHVSSEININTTWKKMTLNLSEYAGKQVRLEFRFDTIDAQGNMYLGWFIDDLVVYGKALKHDIAVTDLKGLKDYVYLVPQNITAMVSNIGTEDENDIEVNLTQNGTTIDQQTISFLASETNTTVNFTWNPPGVGEYDICIESTPVPGEAILWNNYQCKSVNVTQLVFTKIAILRSYGTLAQGPKETWNYLNDHWEDYGSDPVQIDYTSLSIYPITYEAIEETEADVLVLSGSGYYGIEPFGTELDDSEIEAIERWVRGGHGFITIGTAFDRQIPNNNGLVGLVGIVNQPYEMHWADQIQVEFDYINHPIFRNVSNPFQVNFNRTMSSSSDLRWGGSDLDGGKLCAWSLENNSAAIVIYKGSVMISSAVDVTPNEDERQLLYNTFVWSRYEIFDYDVEVSINAPRFVPPSETTNISSIVSNIGKKDLSAVQVDLKVDGNVVDTKNITNLSHMEQAPVNFSWTPSSLGIYQICVFADIIGITDEDPSNNEACMEIEVTDDIPIQVYVLDSWGTDFAEQAPWDYLNENWANHGTERLYINYTRFNKETIRYQELVDSYADVLLISSSRSGNMGDPEAGGYLFTTREMNAIKKYTQEGHGLIGTYLTLDTQKLEAHGNVLGPLFGLKPMNVYYRMPGIHSLSVIDPSENHPLFNNMEFGYDTSNGLTTTPGLWLKWEPFKPDEWFPLNWSDEDLQGGEYKSLSHPTENATVIAHDPGNYKAVYITNFAEKNSNANDTQLLYNAMVWTYYEPDYHDVAMSNLTGPDRVRPSPTMPFTATITNLGAVVEDNYTNGIDVYLTQDGLAVDQTSIPSLGIGASQNITLRWDPPDSPLPQTYEICMKAWPVVWETNMSDNEVCKIVDVIDEDIIVVAVLDSWGTDNPLLAPWDDINANWASFGQYQVLIDYEMLNKEDIALQDLMFSSADVLMISSSNSTMTPTAEFTLDEIAAIQTYVGMGHGIVGTGLTLSTQSLPNNNQLAPLFGIDGGFSFTDTMGVTEYQQLQPSHTVFYHIPDPFFPASGISCTPGLATPDPDGWGPALLLAEGEYLGNSTPVPSAGAIVANNTTKGIYLSNFHEMSSSEDDKQILYNAMAWAAGKTLYPSLTPPPPEDLWISIQGDQLRLDWTVVNPQPDIWFNIFRADTVDGFNFSFPYDQVDAPPYLDEAGTATNSSNYFYVVRAINKTSGLTENNTKKVGKFYNQLHRGTNDISIPFILKDTSVEAVFGAISADIREVAVYDSISATWLRWFPGIGGSLSDVDNTMGIRVISQKNNVDFVTVGRVPVETAIDFTILFDNWFFVGYPCFNTYPLPDILDDNGLMGLYVLVYYYDPTDKKNPWKWFDPNDPNSPLTDFETGKGYWIYMKTSGTWTVPGE
jgi:hypothetical protein